ncbi:acanthoscurrin-2-like [Saccostrea cucullata]|uniref:acanthoscurrin-2-like n=1 Tax=Saccostrea cuccullata TaxID=36930 RepID=UPI002ED50F52
MIWESREQRGSPSFLPKETKTSGVSLGGRGTGVIGDGRRGIGGGGGGVGQGGGRGGGLGKGDDGLGKVIILGALGAWCLSKFWAWYKNKGGKKGGGGGGVDDRKKSDKDGSNINGGGSDDGYSGTWDERWKQMKKNAI